MPLVAKIDRMIEKIQSNIKIAQQKGGQYYFVRTSTADSYILSVMPYSERIQ